MAFFSSCKDCVAPKRHPGCHDPCPEYLAQRAEYDRLKAIQDEKRDIGIAIYYNRAEKVNRAMRNRRYKKI